MTESRRLVALIADTHGHLDERIAALARGCDLIVHAGDIGRGSILRSLAAAGAEVIAIAGNNDTPRHWPADDRAELPGLPATASVQLPGGVLVAVHGDHLSARNRHRRLRDHRPVRTALDSQSGRGRTHADLRRSGMPAARGRERAMDDPLPPVPARAMSPRPCRHPRTRLSRSVGVHLTSPGVRARSDSRSRSRKGRRRGEAAWTKAFGRQWASGPTYRPSMAG